MLRATVSDKGSRGPPSSSGQPQNGMVVGLSLNSAEEYRNKAVASSGSWQGQLVLETAPTGHSPCRRSRDQGSPHTSALAIAETSVYR